MSKLSSAAAPVLLAFAVLLARPARADAVLDWNDVALAEVAASRQLPPDAARTSGRTSTATASSAPTRPATAA